MISSSFLHRAGAIAQGVALLGACAADAPSDRTPPPALAPFLAEEVGAGAATAKQTCLAGTSADYKAAGPYAVKTKVVTTAETGSYTIFYPDPLEPHCPHPIVAWGNGTGVRGASLYAHFHRHAASWGIVVINSHEPNASSGPFLAGGIDYLLEENTREGGEFFGKLSPRAGVAGHSQGGEAANIAGHHPNVQAEVAVCGYGEAPREGVAVLCLTGSNDFANAACLQLAVQATGPAFVADVMDADHVRTPSPSVKDEPASIEWVRDYTAWFRCIIADDQAACALFRSDPAALCGQGVAYESCEGKNIP